MFLIGDAICSLLLYFFSAELMFLRWETPGRGLEGKKGNTSSHTSYQMPSFGDKASFDRRAEFRRSWATSSVQQVEPDVSDG